jgi:hypothetical protein
MKSNENIWKQVYLNYFEIYLKFSVHAKSLKIRFGDFAEFLYF